MAQYAKEELCFTCDEAAAYALHVWEETLIERRMVVLMTLGNAAIKELQLQIKEMSKETLLKFEKFKKDCQMELAKLSSDYEVSSPKRAFKFHSNGVITAALQEWT
jgi:hypothetical protein